MIKLLVIDQQVMESQVVEQQFVKYKVVELKDTNVNKRPSFLKLHSRVES